MQESLRASFNQPDGLSFRNLMLYTLLPPGVLIGWIFAVTLLADVRQGVHTPLISWSDPLHFLMLLLLLVVTYILALVPSLFYAGCMLLLRGSGSSYRSRLLVSILLCGMLTWLILGYFSRNASGCLIYYGLLTGLTTEVIVTKGKKVSWRFKSASTNYG